MIKLVAFDWNGTLLSDTRTALASDNYCLQKLGYLPISLKKFQNSFDIPILKYWTNIGMGEKFFKSHVWEIEQLFHEHYAKLEDKTRTRAGARQTLIWLNRHNVKRMIFSNHFTPRIIKQLIRLNIHEHFDEVLARSLGDNSHMTARGKDQKLYDYVKRNKLKPHEVITVGDTEEEIEIGKAGGFYTAAITGGYNSVKRLKKHHPDFLIHSLKEIIDIVTNLNKKAGPEK